MRFNLISSRWRLMVIISSVFLTLNTVVFGGKRKLFYLHYIYFCYNICIGHTFSTPCVVYTIDLYDY